MLAVEREEEGGKGRREGKEVGGEGGVKGGVEEGEERRGGGRRGRI